MRSGDPAASGGDGGDGGDGGGGGGEKDKGGGGSKFPGSPASEGEIEDPEVIIARRNAEHRRMQARARDSVDDKRFSNPGGGGDAPTGTCSPRYAEAERRTGDSREGRRMQCAHAMIKEGTDLDPI